MSGTFWSIEEVQRIVAEKDEVIAELKTRIDRWNHSGNYIGTNAAIKERDAEIEHLRQQVARLNDEREHYRNKVTVLNQENDALLSAYKERGERMKEMYEWVNGDSDYGGRFQEWFDPETGEPK